jgi:pSer/pThr/pTyr-binding forkhead associated (FHA) protein
MAKFCANGHPLQDSWDTCPYCQRTGFRAREAHRSAGDTRIERVAAPPAPAGADPGGGNTVRRPARRPPIVGWLVALDGPQQGEDFRLHDGQNLIGADPAVDVRLHGAGIATRHASLRHRDAVFTLTDLDSVHCTFLNDTPTSIARETLVDGDRVRIGTVTLRFKSL